MSTFERANEALRHDLAAYATALRTIIGALPQARDYCDRVVKETRLIHALIAFANSPELMKLSQLAMHLGNLWPYRERPYANMLGFDEEINEARRLRDDATQGIQMLARHSREPLAAEVTTCLNKIIDYLDAERLLLEECHKHIQPHAANLDMTRKRLNLLIAAIDARMPASSQQEMTLQAYQQAGDLLRDWESGVPLDERGLDILDRCLDLLQKADTVIFGQLNPGR